jgi:hypothetical protein
VAGLHDIQDAQPDPMRGIAKVGAVRPAIEVPEVVQATPFDVIHLSVSHQSSGNHQVRAVSLLMGPSIHTQTRLDKGSSVYSHSD